LILDQKLALNHPSLVVDKGEETRVLTTAHSNIMFLFTRIQI